MVSPAEGSPLSARSGNDPSESIEIYGPIELKRYVKGDGRALILYTHGESTQDVLARDGPPRA
jgi:hypothetical protein